MSLKSNMLIPLDRAYRVDEAVNTKEKHLVIIRFGHESDDACKQVDEWLASEAEAFKDDAKIYTVAMNAVPELVARYNLAGPSTILFFANNTLVRYLSGDEINQEKIKETVDMMVQKKKIGADTIAVESTATAPAYISLDVDDQEKINSGRTPPAALCKWFWWNKQN